MVQSVIVEKLGIIDVFTILTISEQNKIIVTMDKDFDYLALSYKPLGLIFLKLFNPKSQQT